METITLWTRQVPDVWETLCREEVYQVKEEYIRLKNDTMADYYLDLYRWYTRTARRWIALGEDQQYPIWLSLDGQDRLQLVENTVLLKVVAPKDKVLLCNMDAWGYRVNYWYVPKDEADEQAHIRELSRNGIASDDELISTAKGNFYPLLRDKIKKSWERVFTMTDVPPQQLSATMWELRKEWVEEVLQG